MAIFKRKKKQGSTESFKLVSDFNSPHVPFGSNISKSDVVKIAIDRIASQCAKLKPRYIKTLNDKTVTEKKGALSFILKHKPNEVMTPYQFIYKTITTLLMNDNAFIYPMFDSKTLELKGLYPLTSSVVEPMVDDKDNYYLKFYFENNDAFIIPSENIIHLKRFYHSNDIFGGSNSNGDHDALLKTIGINENVLQGIDNALRSSMQIKGIVKMSAMLSESDKKKQLDTFNLSVIYTSIKILNKLDGSISNFKDSVKYYYQETDQFNNETSLSKEDDDLVSGYSLFNTLIDYHTGLSKGPRNIRSNLKPHKMLRKFQRMFVNHAEKRKVKIMSLRFISSIYFVVVIWSGYA